MASLTGRLRLAVVLPTLNERKNLRKLVARLDEALGGIGWEAIFVDDNSPDGTADEARAINQEDPRIRVIQRIGRRGLASAAIEGMCSTAAPVVAVMDADHQHDPKLLPRMLAAIESGDYDVAYASRFAEGASTEAWGRPDRVKASGFANALARKVTGVDLSDPMSGYFMLRGETLRADAAICRAWASRSCSIFSPPLTYPCASRSSPQLRARAEGESKLDRTVVFEFLVGLYDKWLGHIIPTRFALFGTVGALGVIVQFAMLWLVLTGIDGRAVQIRPLGRRARPSTSPTPSPR
jgi:dolichol-phosphate mannosyltransferase